MKGMNRPAMSYTGPDWRALKEWLEDDLQETYKRLADLTSTEDKTQQLRGRASLLSMMLEFPNLPSALMPRSNGEL